MIVIAKIKAKEGKEAQMERILKAVISDVEKEAGTLIYKLLRSKGDPCEFVFYEKYLNAEALTEHSCTAYFKEMFINMKPFLDGQPEITLYDEVGGFIKHDGI